ncbi:ABC transporter permease [Paenibacillus athensensis]|uniref:Nitrate ABC transporter permease n=1 Tax=Paenibacillus athensensis TaxID=1967502 RepID=A0A4Y8QAJ6_9BACL|nr:ABC transporter permease [Paenibacillus athensensis]MCD1257558.1 ABC transporter permease [Paenibacillus athensensis]
MKLKKWIQAGWPPVSAVILLLLVWQLAVSCGWVEGWLLPSPLQIIAEASNALPRIGMHTAATVRIVLLGFVLGAGIGIALACLLHLAPLLKAALYPLLIVSQNVPTIAIGPLLIIWFGFGLLPKLILIVLVCFFPVCMSTLDGFARTDRTAYNYMQMLGAGKYQLFAKLELPYALPFVFSGLKISATYSVMGAVIAEWLGGSEGLGYYMILQKSSYRVDREFIAIVIIIALSLSFWRLIVWLEKRVIRWNVKR